MIILLATSRRALSHDQPTERSFYDNRLTRPTFHTSLTSDLAQITSI